MASFILIFCALTSLFFTQVSFMNNQKQQKPTLTGQRFKTRKRGKGQQNMQCMNPIQSKFMFGSLTFLILPPQMKRRDLTPLCFKKVSFKAWTRLELIWKRLQSSLMPLAPNLTTAGMLRHSSTSWWLGECWVSLDLEMHNCQEIEMKYLNEDFCEYFCTDYSPCFTRFWV